MDVGVHGGRPQELSPTAAICVGAERGLAEVVDRRSASPGWRRGQLGHVAEMVGEDRRQLEHESRLLEQRQRGLDLGAGSSAGRAPGG